MLQLRFKRVSSLQNGNLRSSTCFKLVLMGSEFTEQTYYASFLSLSPTCSIHDITT
eukprot:m.303492 g.303492  ORF g.303492 m.303492 type:complete len:56 (-) comp16330_c0_seq3:707-874(-)